MKICLIHPKMYVRAYNFFPLSIGHIVSALEKASIPYSFYDLHREWMGTAELVEKIKQEEIQPDVFAITALMTHYKNVIEVCKVLKTNFPDKKIIVGGRLAVIEPEFLFNHLDIDYAIRGEGEVAIIEFIEYLEGKRSAEEVQGLAFINQNDQLIFNGEAKPIENISDYPIPFKSFDMAKYVSKETVQSPNLMSINMLSSRGCPFACAFCNNSKSAFKKQMRYYDIKVLNDAWDYLIKNFGLKHITFNDDIFTVNKQRTKEVCALLKEKGLAFSCSTRLDCLDKEIIEWLDDSGCKYLCIGIESPSPTVAKVIDKRLDLTHSEKNIQNIGLLKETNMVVNFGFMIGHLGETEKTIEETREFVKKHKIIYSAFFATAFPGTVLYDLIKNKIPNEEEYLLKLSMADLSCDYLINMTGIPTKKIYKLHDYLVVDSVLGSFSINLPFKFIVRRMGVLYLVFMRKYGLKLGFFKKIFEFINIVIVKPLSQRETH